MRVSTFRTIVFLLQILNKYITTGFTESTHPQFQPIEKILFRICTAPIYNASKMFSYDGVGEVLTYFWLILPFYTP